MCSTEAAATRASIAAARAGSRFVRSKRVDPPRCFLASAAVVIRAIGHPLIIALACVQCSQHRPVSGIIPLLESLEIVRVYDPHRSTLLAKCGKAVLPRFDRNDQRILVLFVDP